MKFAVVCDSSADLTPEEVREQNITVVPFYISLNGTDYLKEGVELSIDSLYRTMAEDPQCFPKTSMPTIPDYLEVFRSFARQGMPVICICLTKTFSGSYQSALNASLQVQSEDSSARIHVVDSRLATALQGLMVKEAARLRDLDLSAEEALPYLEAMPATGHIFFTTKDLKYLQHGGRLSKAAYLAGSMLDIKPLLYFHEGDLTKEGVCRGHRKALSRIVDIFFEFLRRNPLDLSEYYIGTGIGTYFPEYDGFVEEFLRRIREAGLTYAGHINMKIGATIGVHTGPYPVGLGLMKKCDI